MLVEFLVIGLGIMLGLLGDDVRESFSEREVAREYLELLLRDLDLDVEALNVTRRGLEAQSTATQTILDATRGEAVSQSQLERAFSGLYLTWTYEQPHPTFESLRASGAFRLIDDPDLRAEIADYFEIQQERVQAYVLDYRIAQQAAATSMAPYVRALPASEFETFWPLGRSDFVELLVPLAVFVQDHVAWSDMAGVGARTGEAVDLIDSVLERNRALGRRISEVLEERGLGSVIPARTPPDERVRPTALGSGSS
jgi:hypothetical protein